MAKTNPPSRGPTPTRKARGHETVPPARGPTEQPFEHEDVERSGGPLYRPTREIRLDDAPKGAPQFLLHVRFPDSASLSRSCIYDDRLTGLRLAANGPTLGAHVEIVLTLDVGSMKLWCARGKVMRRKPFKDRDAELDVSIDEGYREATDQLDSVVMGVAPAKTQRTEDRVPVRLWTTVADGSAEKPQKLLSLDFSPNGVGLQCEEPPPIGTPLRVDVKQGLFAKPLQLRGVVCWEKAARGFGVRFLFDSKEQRDALDALLKKYG